MRSLSKAFAICIILMFAVFFSSSVGASPPASFDSAIADVYPVKAPVIADVTHEYVSFQEIGFDAIGLIEVQDTMHQASLGEFTINDNSLKRNCAGCHTLQPSMVQRE